MNRDDCLDSVRNSKAAFTFLLKMSSKNKSITINIGPRDSKQFAADLSNAITELKLLAFERRTLDLDQNQCYAMFVLTDLQDKLKQIE